MGCSFGCGDLRSFRGDLARQRAGIEVGSSFGSCENNWIAASLRSLALTVKIRLSRSRDTGRRRLRARPAHPRQQFGGRPGIRRQAVFDLHRLDRAAALLAHHAVDLADIEAGAHQELLQLAQLVERQLRDRRPRDDASARRPRCAWRDSRRWSNRSASCSTRYRPRNSRRPGTPVPSVPSATAARPADCHSAAPCRRHR